MVAVQRIVKVRCPAEVVYASLKALMESQGVKVGWRPVDMVPGRLVSADAKGPGAVFGRSVKFNMEIEPLSGSELNSARVTMTISDEKTNGLTGKLWAKKWQDGTLAWWEQALVTSVESATDSGKAAANGWMPKV